MSGQPHQLQRPQSATNAPQSTASMVASSYITHITVRTLDGDGQHGQNYWQPAVIIGIYFRRYNTINKYI